MIYRKEVGSIFKKVGMNREGRLDSGCHIGSSAITGYLPPVLLFD
jgi:hypothetical protein